MEKEFALNKEKIERKLKGVLFMATEPDYSEFPDLCPELLRLLRGQRHDFLNHIQVVHALLQLNKIDRAKEYLENLAKDTEMVKNTLKLHYQPEGCRRIDRV